MRNPTASAKANERWGGGGVILDQHGNYMPPPTPPGGTANYKGPGDGDGGGSLASRIGSLESDVSTLKKQVGWIFVAGLAAIIISFLTLDGRIDERFDKADDKSEQIARDLNDMKTDNARNFERVLVRLDDDKSQTGAGHQPAQPVRERAGSGNRGR